MISDPVGVCYSFIDAFFSIIRLASKTCFKRTIPFKMTNDMCLIMGNGPSLIKSLENNRQKLSELDLVAVNFMANSPEFIEYKPNSYVLCDPAFWFDVPSEELKNRVRQFYVLLSEKTHWNMQLYIPYQASKQAEIKTILSQNPNLHLRYYNKTKFEGYQFLNYRIYNKQWGMPRAQNVIVAALMLSIYSGYKEIYLAGVDSDYLKNIWVDENNNVRFDDFHFYKDSKENTERIIPGNLHDECLSSYYMFKSYVDIEQYAIYRKTKIYNTGIHSFIDAFEKKAII